MKQIEKLIGNLSSKFKVDIEQYTRLYQDGLNREELAEALNMSEYAVRAIAQALNLRMALKYRAKDLALYYSRFEDSEVNVKLNEVAGDLDASYKDNVKLERQITALRRELSKYKSVFKDSPASFDVEDIQQLVKESMRPMRAANVTIATRSDYYKDYTQFILLSDLHFEEAVNSNDVGLANSYNWEEAERRLSLVFQESLQAYRGESKCIILLGGDLLSGIIHDTLESTTKPTGQAVVELAQILADHTNALQAVYEEIEVMFVTGNHGRLSEQRKSHGQGYNLEHMMVHIMKGLTADSVKYNVSTTGYCISVVGDKVIALHHGDFHRAGYGIPRVLKVQEAIRQTTGVVPYTIFQGHTHTPLIESSPSGGQYITNGSLIGINGYTHTNGFIGLPWSQTIGSFMPDGTIENTRWISD